MSKQGLRMSLGPSKSELGRRPAFGWSFFIASVQRLLQSLVKNEGAEARAELQQLLETEDGQAFLEALSETQWEKAKDNPSSKREDFELALTFLKENQKELLSLASDIVIAAAAQYVGALHFADAVVKSGALGSWAELVPDEEHLSPALEEWRSTKANVRTTS
eukprot:8966386-Karenia_brevis.AAC.1